MTSTARILLSLIFCFSLTTGSVVAWASPPPGDHGPSDDHGKGAANGHDGDHGDQDKGKDKDGKHAGDPGDGKDHGPGDGKDHGDGDHGGGKDGSAMGAFCGSVDGDDAQVAQVRATIDERCQCETAHSHGKYMSCATHIANRAVKDGSLRDRCRDAVVGCAERSTCGRKGFIT